MDNSPTRHTKKQAHTVLFFFSLFSLLNKYKVRLMRAAKIQKAIYRATAVSPNSAMLVVRLRRSLGVGVNFASYCAMYFVAEFLRFHLMRCALGCLVGVNEGSSIPQREICINKHSLIQNITPGNSGNYCIL
jgi:hypothetical protein